VRECSDSGQPTSRPRKPAMLTRLRSRASKTNSGGVYIASITYGRSHWATTVVPWGDR